LRDFIPQTPFIASRLLKAASFIHAVSKRLLREGYGLRTAILLIPAQQGIGRFTARTMPLEASAKRHMVQRNAG